MLRDSEDEQIMADIALSIIFGKPFKATQECFDGCYGKGDHDYSGEVILKLNRYGVENLKRDIKTVYAAITNFCDNYLGNTKLRYLVNPDAAGNPIKTDFYAIFMAFYQLMILEQKEPFNYSEIVKGLKNIHPRLSPTQKYVSIEDRKRNIAFCVGVLQTHFKPSKDIFRSPTSFRIDFENYLMRSKVETAHYDFKQGLLPISDHDRSFSDDQFEKIVIKSISALANLGKNQQGLLFIGVTDKEADTVKVEALDHLTHVPRIHGFGIVGLEREATIRGVSLDRYISFITEKISKSPLPPSLKTKILTSITPITYNDHTVLMISVISGMEPVFLRDKLYVRDGANTKEVSGEAIGAVYNLFK